MEVIRDALEIISQGGWVTIPLLVLSGLMSFTTIFRFLTLRRSFKGSSRQLISAIERGKLNEKHACLIVDYAYRLVKDCSRKTRKAFQDQVEELMSSYDAELLRYRSVLHTLVMIAPLLGLLGTVIGMIETFDSLGDMNFHSQSGGIAGGISQALITTQIGLVIAIPGWFCDRFLARREERIRNEMLQIKEIVSQTLEV